MVGSDSVCEIFITAHRHIRSSVYLSVTLLYCVKTRERRRMRSLPSARFLADVSRFLMPRMVDGGRPYIQVKFECKEVDPL